MGEASGEDNALEMEQVGAEGLGDLQDMVIGSPSVEEFLTEFAEFSAATLSEGTELLCTVTLERNRQPTTVACSHEQTRVLDEAQYALGHGPCLEALRTGSTVVVEDIWEETRWPDYAAAVRGQGIRSILAIGLAVGPYARAVLNCYAVIPGAFGERGLPGLRNMRSRRPSPC